MKSESSSLLVGLAAGVAVGAIFGILFAPDKGCETRRKLTRRSKEKLNDWQDQLNDIKEKYNHSLDLIGEKLKEIERESSMNRQ